MNESTNEWMNEYTSTISYNFPIILGCIAFVFLNGGDILVYFL